MYRMGIVLLCIVFVLTIFLGPLAPPAHGVVISTVIVGTVLAAMAAAGIGLTVSGMTASQLSDWVGGKLSSWATSLGGSVQDHIDSNLINVTASGIISVGTAAAGSISDFISWLIGEESITSNTTGELISGNGIVQMTDTAGTYDICAARNQYFQLRPVTVPTYVTTVADTSIGWAGPIAVTLAQATFQFSSSSNGYSQNPGWRTASTSQYNSTTGLYYATEWWVSYDSSVTVISNTHIYPSIQSALNGIKYAIDNNTFGQALEYNTGTITVPTIDTTTQDKWFIDVGAAPGSTIETVTDGVIADTIDGDLTVSDEIAEEEPEFIVDEPIAIAGLSEVFPFCIPFDIYALLSCLSSDPVTPVFTARFVVPGIINQEFTIDLSPFNSVAQIVRTMELLAFIIGLALVTRERFLRS